MQNICQDRKDKIDKGIAVTWRANTHTHRRKEKKAGKNVVMTLICHKYSISNHLWKKNK